MRTLVTEQHAEDAEERGCLERFGLTFFFNDWTLPGMMKGDAEVFSVCKSTESMQSTVEVVSVYVLLVDSGSSSCCSC